MAWYLNRASVLIITKQARKLKSVNETFTCISQPLSSLHVFWPKCYMNIEFTSWTHRLIKLTQTILGINMWLWLIIQKAKHAMTFQLSEGGTHVNLIPPLRDVAGTWIRPDSVFLETQPNLPHKKLCFMCSSRKSPSLLFTFVLFNTV